MAIRLQIMYRPDTRYCHGNFVAAAVLIAATKLLTSRKQLVNLAVFGTVMAVLLLVIGVLHFGKGLFFSLMKARCTQEGEKVSPQDEHLSRSVLPSPKRKPVGVTTFALQKALGVIPPGCKSILRLVEILASEVQDAEQNHTRAVGVET